MKIKELLEVNVVKGDFSKNTDKASHDEVKKMFNLSNNQIASSKDYWDSYDSESNQIKRSKLRELEKAHGPYKVYDAKDLYGFSHKPERERAPILFFPEEKMIIVKFDDGDEFWCQPAKAWDTKEPYIYGWKKIVDD